MENKLWTLQNWNTGSQQCDEIQILQYDAI
jgi:hypothetical protein